MRPDTDQKSIVPSSRSREAISILSSSTGRTCHGPAGHGHAHTKREIGAGGLAHGFEHHAAVTHAAVQRSAIAVGPLVGDRRPELVHQVVGCDDLQPVEPGLAADRAAVAKSPTMRRISASSMARGKPRCRTSRLADGATMGSQSPALALVRLPRCGSASLARRHAGDRNRQARQRRE